MYHLNKRFSHLTLAVLGENWENNKCFNHKVTFAPIDDLQCSKYCDVPLLEVPQNMSRGSAYEMDRQAMCHKNGNRLKWIKT